MPKEATRRYGKNKMSTEKMVLAAVMTALVVLFQLLAEFTKFFGPFSTAMALIPIVIGGAMCGIWVGGWLGLVFGMTVLFCPSTTLFLQFSIMGTAVTVLLKGILCGLAGAFVYSLFKKRNKFVGVVSAALVCPVVNTSVFLLGCAAFFLKDAKLIAEAIGSNASGMEVFFVLALANFAVEICSNLLLSPIIVRILHIKKV